MIVIVVGIEDAPRHSSKSFRTFTSKPWIWGFLKYRNPNIVFSHWSKAVTWMILGYTGMPPFQIPPTIPPLPERLPSHDRRTETNARPHPHRHAQNRRCPSWYVQQHSWRELGVLHISIHFHEIHLVCCFFYDYTDAPTKTEKSFVTTFFSDFFTRLSYWGLL